MDGERRWVVKCPWLVEAIFRIVVARFGEKRRGSACATKGRIAVFGRRAPTALKRA